MNEEDRKTDKELGCKEKEGDTPKSNSRRGNIGSATKRKGNDLEERF